MVVWRLDRLTTLYIDSNMSLRSKVIRLAVEHPEFRAKLLPILSNREANDDPSVETQKQIYDTAHRIMYKLRDIPRVPDKTHQNYKEEEDFLDALGKMELELNQRKF